MKAVYFNERHRAEDAALRLLGSVPQRGGMLREEFGPLLKSFRLRTGRSRNNLSHEVGVDPSYSTRIEAGDREPPRLHIVLSYARALRLTPMEKNRLLAAAGYAPAEVVTHGWSDTLQAVTDVLSDPFLSPEEREMFEMTVKNIAQRWRAAPVLPRLMNGVEASHV